MYIGRKILLRKERENEIVMLHKSSGCYCVVNRVAAEIAYYIDKESSKREILEKLKARYNIGNDYANFLISETARQMHELVFWNDKEGYGKRTHAPLRAGWRLTGKCNLRCRHCYLSCSPDSVVRDLSHNESMRVAEQICDTEIMDIVLTGGELFVRHDARNIIEYIAKKGIRLSIFTNATLVDETYAWMKDIPLHCVNVSLDGREKEHDALRGNGVFQKTWAGIERLREWGIRITVNCVISKLNMNSIDEIALFFKQEELEHQFTLITPTGNALLNKAIVPSIADFKKVVRRLKAIEQDLEHGNGEHNELDVMAKVEKTRFNGESINAWKCNAGNTKIDIDVNGDVYLCPFDSSTKIGNILRDDLKALWVSTPIRKEFLDRMITNVERTCFPIKEIYDSYYSKDCGICD